MPFYKRMAACGLVIPAVVAFAQEPEPTVQLAPLTVVASRQITNADELPYPVAIISASDLEKEASGTLGDTLGWLPGVSASDFAPGASRPIIRGQDGPRVRIMETGLDSFDVSETSPDHAVSIDPLLAGDVEVLRGPGTLLYGGSAIGGVVSVNPAEIPFDALKKTGPSGLLGGRLNSGSHGGTLLGRATQPLLGGSIRLQGSWRNEGDVAVPDDYILPPDEDEGGDATGENVDRLPNSFVHTRYGAAGWGTGWDGGLAGLSSSIYRSRYGVPAEAGEGVFIKMKRIRHAGQVELDEPFRAVRHLTVKAAYGDYWHEEWEGDELGTRFERKGWDTRVEAVHQPVGSVEGTVGGSFSNVSFSANGEESFIAPSDVRTQAAFVVEEMTRGDWWMQAGARVERQSIDVHTDLPDYEDTAPSFSFAVNRALQPGWSLGLVASYASRHPTAIELFADGPHAGTDRYQIGDADLDVEQARSIELSLKRTSGRVTGSLQLYLSDYDDYILLRDTDAEEDGMTVAEFGQTDARFYGGEAEIDWAAIQNDLWSLHLSAGGDRIVARDRVSDDPLPRTPPARLWVRADFISANSWRVGARVRHAFEQDETALGEEATDSYTTADFLASADFNYGGLRWSAYAGLMNVLDELGYDHTSYSKPFAPVGGRRIECGISARL